MRGVQTADGQLDRMIGEYVALVRGAAADLDRPLTELAVDAAPLSAHPEPGTAEPGAWEHGAWEHGGEAVQTFPFISGSP